MSVLQVNNLELTFGGRQLLRDVSLIIEDRGRMALAGANGSGKSTLMKILVGQLQADKGTISLGTGKRVRYLSQSGLVFKDASILDIADQAFDELHKDAVRIQELEHLLENATEGQTPQLLNELHDLQEHLLASQYHERRGVIEHTLLGLGFTKKQFDQGVHSLSGGWQMRLALAQVLLSSPHLMLLDEPTNYLDLETREWLLAWLKRYDGAVLLVSHDRYILDNAINQVAELYQGRLKTYKGSYTAYEQQRTLELQQVIAAWKKQQDEIEHLEKFVERFKAKATKATQAQSRVKQLEKIERIEIPDGVRTVHFSFPPPPPSGEIAFSMLGLSKNYGPKEVLASIDLDIPRGTKLALLGKNGAGKSTLLRILAGVDQASSGTLKVGHNVSLAYFAQDADTALDPNNTILEELESMAPTSMIPQLRTLLGSFLFHDDDVFKPIQVLSGGEKNRVALVKMLLMPSNVLILDEPTNHLDLTSKEILLDALKAFPGTVIFVSHDRYFIRDLATHIFAIEPVEGAPSRHQLYLGNFDYYQWKISENTDSSSPDGRLKSTNEEKVVSQNQVLREDQKKLKTALKKAERQEAELLQRIEELEGTLKNLNHDLALPENYSNGAKIKVLQDQIKSHEAELVGVQASWEESCSLVEDLQSRITE